MVDPAACADDVLVQEGQKPAAATRPIGTLIQKIQAQEKCWMIRPPASGPTTAEIAQTLAR